MTYPCIVYKRDNIRPWRANNALYKGTTRYMVTVIDPNPDSDIPMKVAALPFSLYNRGYAADELNHDVFILYF